MMMMMKMGFDNVIDLYYGNVHSRGYRSIFAAIILSTCKIFLCSMVFADRPMRRVLTRMRCERLFCSLHISLIYIALA